MSLVEFGKQITIYGGLFILTIGVIGNAINILVFSTVRIYRTSPSSFYLLIASIVNILYLTINLISRIVGLGFGFDLSRISTSWCKSRAFFIFTFSLITLTCSCLATIDQFFVTSRSVKLRGFSSLKWAHRIVVIVILIWCLHGIPVILLYHISSSTTTCANTNAVFAVYASIYLLGLICAIPVFIMITFGYLTYRNIHSITTLVTEQVDRQLTEMILIQVLLVVVCILPYGINNAYTLITSGIKKDANRLAIESFIVTIIGLLSYFYYAGSCYVFLISSSRFRQSTKERLFFFCEPNEIDAI